MMTQKLFPLLPRFAIRMIEGKPWYPTPARRLADLPAVRQVSFVLLQYNHAEVTIACVESLLALEAPLPVKIIIVDNGSRDDAYLRISEYASAIENVTVIRNTENAGFAQGNNIGYVHARNESNEQLVCVINNDIVIHDAAFLRKLLAIYRKTAFSVLGPDIVVPGSKIVHQNPLGYHVKTAGEIEGFIARMEDRILKIKSGTAVLSVPNPHGRWLKDPFTRRGNLVLHGAAYVFSPIFVEAFGKPFDDRTFLYGEEDLLALNASRKGFLQVYSPGLTVYHLTKSSTSKDDLEKYYLFRYENNIKSAKIYLDLLGKE